MPLGFVAEAEPSLQPPASALERAIGSKGQVGITDLLLRLASNFDLIPSGTARRILPFCGPPA